MMLHFVFLSKNEQTVACAELRKFWYFPALMIKGEQIECIPQVLQPYCSSPSAAERPYLPSLLARDRCPQGSEGRQGGIRIQGSRRGGSIQREAGCPGEEKENQVEVENHGRLNSHVQSQVRFSMKYPSMYLVLLTFKRKSIGFQGVFRSIEWIFVWSVLGWWSKSSTRGFRPGHLSLTKRSSVWRRSKRHSQSCHPTRYTTYSFLFWASTHL